MATTTAFNSLSVPAPDDTMEMSSPANRNLDDDIDFDFDDYQGGVQVTDDDRMIDDADLTRPGTGTDDMMEDDILPGERGSIEEEVMADDAPEIQVQEDEELIDYGDDDFQDDFLEDTMIPNVTEEATELAEAGFEEVEEEIAHAPEPSILSEPAAEVQEQAPPPQGPVANAEDFLAPNVTAGHAVEAEADDLPTSEPKIFDSTGNVNFDFPEEPPTAEEVAEQSIHVDTGVSAQHDTPGTPTDTGLHPMTIRYGNIDIPLFRSRRQPEGLLKDDNLANLSLAELIRNCRQQLAIKIGENLSEDQELVLGFDHMGLMLVEDSRAAFESSLNDVLEVYLQLHRNDGTNEIPSLSLTLSLQLKFSSSFSILKQAATSGQGMSMFGFYVPTGDEGLDHEEYEEDQGNLGLHENDQAEDGQEDHIYNETGEIEHDAAAYPVSDAADGEAGEYEEYEHDEEQEYHQDAEETYDEDAPAPPPGLRQILQGGNQAAEQSADAVYNAPDNPAATGQAAVGESRTAKGNDSRASSATVQGDAANTNAGEYDDIIDWDDDTLMSEFSARTSDDDDEFSTFLTEIENEEQNKDAKDSGHSNTIADSAEGQDIGFTAEDPNHQAFDGQHLSSEDFLNDLGEHEYANETQYQGHGNGEEEEYDGEDQEYDQADNYDAQQDEYHPDYQPGEDSEHYHTAQDFLDGENYDDHLQYDEEDALDDTVNTVVHYPVEEQAEDDAQEDFEDELGFDEETAEHQDASTMLQHSTSGKRSFDEHADEDDLEFDDRELKKARAT